MPKFRHTPFGGFNKIPSTFLFTPKFWGMVINIGTKLARITPQEGTAMKLTTQIKATQTITPQLIGTMTILSYSAKEL